MNSRFEENREREKTQFAGTSYNNLSWLFWRSNCKTLSNRDVIFIEDSLLIFLQTRWWDCLLGSVDALGILARVVIRTKFLLQSGSIVSEIQRQNLIQLLWKFYWSFITHNT